MVWGRRSWSLDCPPQEFCSLASEHLELAKSIGIRLRPKHHSLLEMGVRSAECGSPSLGSCWADESINRVLKTIAAGCQQQAHYHERLLADFEATAGIGAKRPRTG